MGESTVLDGEALNCTIKVPQVIPFVEENEAADEAVERLKLEKIKNVLRRQVQESKEKARDKAVKDKKPTEEEANAAIDKVEVF